MGSLEVTVVGCTRLPELENEASQYCSLSVDQLPWSQLVENRRAMWPTFEVGSSVFTFSECLSFKFWVEIQSNLLQV